MALEYRIEVLNPASREIEVQLTLHVDEVGREDGTGDLQLFLPTWTPGSYLQREFARHLSRISATDGETGRPLPCSKISKNRFRVGLDPATIRARIRYRVYAHELTVRTADLTARHAFWNHACLLLWPVDQPGLAARLVVVFPRTWQLACALERGGPEAVDQPDTRAIELQATGLDRVHDSPCLLGEFVRFDWSVQGVPHSIILDDLAGISLPNSLRDDLTAIVRQVSAVFGGPLPYPRYLFLVLCTSDGHGGLEHAESTVLLVSRTSFASAKGYREFLSLAAHELFHAWNVKRLRPVEFWRYDYEKENYTEFLWLIEGWTAYYDDLVCVRAGLMSRADYWEAVAKNINGMLAAPGRLRLSLRESSYDAWIRLYRPDENTRNSSQNYYGNGAVAAMYLDLTIRRDSGGKRCLDHVLAGLYATTYQRGRGYDLEDVHRALRDVGGESSVRCLADLIDDRLDPALEPLLQSFGLKLQVRDAERPFLGVQFEAGSTVVASVTFDSPAFVGGVQPGDEILALRGLRVDANRWPDVLAAAAKVGDAVDILLARRGVISSCQVQLRKSPGSVAIEVDLAAPKSALALLDDWVPDRDRSTVVGEAANPSASSRVNAATPATPTTEG